MAGASESAGRSKFLQNLRQERKIPMWDMCVERQGNAWNLSFDRERCA
jgi:hypothetical protein